MALVVTPTGSRRAEPRRGSSIGLGHRSSRVIRALTAMLLVLPALACERSTTTPAPEASPASSVNGAARDARPTAPDHAQPEASTRLGGAPTAATAAAAAPVPPDDLPTVLRDRLWLSIGGETFSLELALTDEARYQGLSDRRSIAADGGMAFVFPQADELAFVMRRCLVPIDILFVDDAGRIVAAHAMTVEPYNRPEFALRRYHSGVPVRYAIELRGGTIRRLGLEIGDVIQLPHDRLKSLAR